MTTEHAALLVADVQRDFCAGGTLAVQGGDDIVGPLNRYIEDAVAHGLTVYAVRDWHPPITKHFKAYGGPWPPHCIQDTEGARFHPQLRLPATAIVITKGADPDSAGYSAFEGRTPEGKPFPTELSERGIRSLFIGGIATDYCVRASVLDALSAGLEVTILEDAIAGVDPDESARAMAEMRTRGAAVGRGRDAFRGAPDATQFQRS